MKNYRFNDGTCSLFVLLNDEVLDFALINDIKFLIKHKRKKKKKNQTTQRKEKSKTRITVCFLSFPMINQSSCCRKK
jgi:hypothetical protein